LPLPSSSHPSFTLSPPLYHFLKQQENLALLRRLQQIKPSGDISRHKLMEEHVQQKTYARNLQRYKD
jgi:hypothetical protein